MSALSRRRHGALRTTLRPIVLVLCLLAPTAVSAQVLTLSPVCGVAGTTQINIMGSGWAEPDPPCEYIFYFNGVEIAPRQPDGLFGPPNSSFVIPPGTPVGCYLVKVELRITETQRLIQCMQDSIQVVAAVQNPWNVQLAPDSIWIRLTFDPTNVCDFGDCDSIYFIQTRQLTGTRNTGTTRRVTYLEQGWANGDSIDMDFTAAGVGIDRIWGRPVPYYGQPPGASRVGFNGKPTQAAIMFDRPRRPDRAYSNPPPDSIVTLTLSFEVGVFCGAGAERGKYLGGINWTWSRNRGSGVTTGKITNSAGHRNQPTMAFTDALARWNTNHGFNLPQPGVPTRGGVPCP